ncbi:MAG: hypothetical protein ACPGR8_17500, partial [Limisphaerales bacterium]
MAEMTMLAVLAYTSTEGDTCQFTALLHAGRNRLEVPFMPRSRCKTATIVETLLVPPGVAETLPRSPKACVNRRFSVRAEPPKENARLVPLDPWFQTSSSKLRIVPP